MRLATIQDIEQHYDANNQVFLRILDPDYLAYSCGHWSPSGTARDLQFEKFKYIAEKIDLGRRGRVLEIGSGWGSFAKFCHDYFPHVQVVGLTLSAEQKAYVDSRGWLNFRCVVADWRTFETSEPFDAIVSIESLEHYASMADRRLNRHIDVYRAFFERMSALSGADAPLYVQSSIARAAPDDFQGARDARYIVEKVFQGSALATIGSLQAATYPTYEFEELHLMGPDMIRTIADWRDNLIRQADEIRSRFGVETYEFFLRYFDAAIRRFEKKHVDLLELTLRKARLG